MEAKVKTETVTMRLPCKFSCTMGGWPTCPSTSPCTSSCAPGHVCTFETADVSFRVVRLLLVEHNVTMHEVEPSAGDVELSEFLKGKMK